MLQGYVEGCDAYAVTGWAYDARIDGAPELQVFVDDVMVGTLWPDQHREDLQALNIHCPAGFCHQFKTRPAFGSMVAVKTADGQALNGSPVRYDRQDLSAVFDGTLDLRKDLSYAFLAGEGIEIGALNNPLPTAPMATVRYVDRMTPADLNRQYPEIEITSVVPPDIVDDGETLGSLKNDSQSFVIANHFLEHAEDPIRCIQNFARVLKPGGIIYLALPDKEKTFDRHRKETTLRHLLMDYRLGGRFSRKRHYRQWARYVKGLEGRQIGQQARALAQQRYSIHFHVWTFEAALNFISYLAISGHCPLRVVLALKNPPNEMIFILKKEP